MKKHTLLILFFLLGTAASAAVKLPALFSDHAVLARRVAVPVWGKADPGEKVTVALGKKSASTTAGKDGKWMVKLDLADSPEGPFELQVNDIAVKDVLVGEVWLCSGQSNMEFRLEKALGAQKEIARSDRKLRNFHVPVKAVFSPAEEPEGHWVASGPESSGKFSAVAYFFGQKLRRELNCPVGLIHSSRGGSAISPWVPEDAMKEVPEEVERQKSLMTNYREYPQKAQECLEQRIAWEKRYDRADSVSHKLPGPDAKWERVLPAMKDFNGNPGAVWFRYYFMLPEVPGKAPELSLWRQTNTMQCYVNGTFIGEIPLPNAIQRIPFSPKIPVKLLKPGKNELLIRVFSSGECPMINDTISYIGKLLLESDQWEVCREREFAPPTEKMRKEYPALSTSAPGPERLGSTLYNGMIAPLRHCALSGILWYQGESDCGRAALYRQLFPALIRSWRREFNDPELPFFYCQLPCFGKKTAEAPQQECRRAELRDAQDSALALPHTGAAVLIDQGEADDIHPLEKRIPGERLAALALTQLYGKKGVCSGPRFASCRVEKGRIRIRFTSTGSGLMARALPAEYPLSLLRKQKAKLVPPLPESPLQGFAVRTGDGKWLRAQAEIDGDEVVVTPPAKAVQLRYAWEENPTCNLCNCEGFPAAPFSCRLPQEKLSGR